MNKNTSKILLIIALLAIIAVPVLFMPTTIFIGTDDKAINLIAETAPNYKPWLQSIWKPEAGTEALLFTLQAAVGSFVLGYILGLLRGKSKVANHTGVKNVQD